ncbi:hypothetical protein BA059_00220 [Mycolicibacterium sp. (ex Dasyatis americana)]|nr:hypothetical protein BA059_00220 [Mycolicibacterium sp. (ex Dasyatis americana)]
MDPGREDQVDPVVPVAQEAQEGPNVAMVGLVVVLTGPAGRADRVGQGRGARVTEVQADQMTMAGTGARRPRSWPGAAWTKAGSTTSRSTTTVAG